MPIRKPMKPLRLCISLFAVAGLLAGCAQGAFSTQEARIGPNDSTDPCRAQLVALDSTGNYFGTQILTGAAVGAVAGGALGALIGRDWKGALIGAAAGGALGAAGGYWSALQQQQHDQAGMFTQVSSDLARENTNIDRTQQAFDQLMDCRFRQAQAIRVDYKAGRIDRSLAEARMGTVKQHVQHDLALAKQINGQIQGRSEQFEVAADNLAPGTKTAIATQAPAPRPATVRRAAPLKLQPDPAAADIGQLNASDPVIVTPSRSGYVLVQTPSGARGYAPASAIQGATGSAPLLSSGGSGGNDVRMLAGSNAARRDSFSQSVAVSEQAAASGFELAS
ncbi:SH3 domain-containing protein [Limobrevibacterium gyesilva]|uniref:SH3 domain-containing protein n=1 Tax=Limobrevibacterium gyesilva TaxID=2991712 RepID=A0AA42CJF9_9PROT|nr:SH3 domain-containing protein [Limobrevibacterium gyesilva]MCW3476867.1 SH3 domain-containing protein [Limobrevibacterium gyesilva]